jgi:glutamate racemase
VFRVLADSGALRAPDLPAPTHGFTTTGDAEEFRRLARRFLGPEVGDVYGDSAVRSIPARAGVA